MKKIDIKLKDYILWGLIFAFSGEILDNFIINHRSYILLLIILPIYTLLIWGAFYIYKRLNLSPLYFCLLGGLIGLIVIENIILGKYTESWPIQIFMFSYWFSIISYPFLMIQKQYKWLLLPISIGIFVSILMYIKSYDLFLTLAFFQFVFWIISAIMNGYFLKKQVE